MSHPIIIPPLGSGSVTSIKAVHPSPQELDNQINGESGSNSPLWTQRRYDPLSVIECTNLPHAQPSIFGLYRQSFRDGRYS